MSEVEGSGWMLAFVAGLHRATGTMAAHSPAELIVEIRRLIATVPDGLSADDRRMVLAHVENAITRLAFLYPRRGSS
jgi:hypothetical protein